MSRVQNYSFSGYPSSYDTENSSVNGDFDVNNGCTDTNSTTRARFQGSSQKDRIWYYKFNTSTIPQFASISSVSWKAKVTVSKNKDIWTLSLSNLTTSVGDAQTPTKVTTYTTPETDGGNWNEAPAVYKMINSTWVKQTDAQNIFTNSVYLKTDGTLFIRKNL